MSRPPFECQRCGQCCQGRGGIYYQDEEVEAAAQEMGLDREIFIQRYLIYREQRWEVAANPEGNCVLLGPEGCLVHRAKPTICRRWPFFDALINDSGAFEEAKLACPGIDPELSHQDFVRFAQKMHKESVKL